jgi:hypothetical protein
MKPIGGKNPHAVALARLGAKKGGEARARKLSPRRRREIARKAVTARWERYWARHATDGTDEGS